MVLAGFDGPIGEHGDATFIAFGITDDELVLGEVNVFDPQLQDFA
jgi:hypothetical protein